METYFDQDIFKEKLATLDVNRARFDKGTTSRQRLSRWTAPCLIINRTIGSGIFVTPAFVLRGTGSVGSSLVLWAIGGIFALCGLYVWLEFGLSSPQYKVEGHKQGIPRNGGEKNYLEYVYHRKKQTRLTTCMFGIAFIILGNLSGNAYAGGIYIMRASGSDPTNKGPVIGIAIGLLSLAIAIHMFTRYGGIVMNNCFAIYKILLLLAIIIIGGIKASKVGYKLGGDHGNALGNYHHPFASTHNNAANYAGALVYVVYTYSGFEQPFYVLAEFEAPRLRFTKYTVLTMISVLLLFVLTNAAYFFVVPIQDIFDHPNADMATLFVRHTFGTTGAEQAMAALTALSIFGNIIVMTFTASRVKQELAKEGILFKPSLFFATGITTPAARMWARMRGRPINHAGAGNAEDAPEQTPAAALLLHWFFSVLLVSVTAPLSPQNAFKILVSLYTYVLVVLVGFFVSLGLLILKFRRQRGWAEKSHFKNYPIISTIPPTVYLLVNGFLMIMAFIRPNPLPSYKPYYIVPVIGITAPLWGLAWYGLIRAYTKVKGRPLQVTRTMLVMDEPGNPGFLLMRAEIVDHDWEEWRTPRGTRIDGDQEVELHDRVLVTRQMPK